MKKYTVKHIAIISLGVLIIIASGCNKLKDFGDTNISPNGVAEPNLSALLTNSLIGLSGYVTTNAPAYFCQYRGESTYPGISKYTGLNINASGNYSGILQDCQVIITKCTDPNFASKAAKYGDLGSQEAIATLLKVFQYWGLTDRWGDLPYSEALKGAAVLLPKYDKQEDIYSGLLTDIEYALGKFNTGSNATVQGDVIYAGDVTKWRKFGNSLRMLIAIRMTKRYPSAGQFAAIEFNKSLNSPYGYIATNADNFSIKYPGGVFPNPVNALNVSQDEAVALTFTDALNGMGDTRRASMASLTNGVPYGLSGAAPIGTPYARLMNGSFAADNSSLPIINAASVLLAKAEAIERGWVPSMTTADAKIAYEDAITASFAQWAQTIPASYLSTVADYNSGVGGGSIGGTSVAGSSAATTSKLERIALQQWIAFFPAGLQGWSNWRRTGIPILRPTIFATNPMGQIPRRYTYGTSDYTTNLVQVNIAVARIPGAADSQDAKLWWDQ